MEHDDLGHDPHRDKPRKAGKRELVGRLNRLDVALNFAKAEVSEIRHSLGVADCSDPKRQRARIERAA